MTVIAHCPQCNYPFTSNAPHPVTPPHPHPATGLACAGTSQIALTGVS